MTDVIDRAIQAAEQPKTVPLARVQLLLPTSGRPAAIECPADMTDAEWLELVGYITTVLAPTLRAQRPVSRILIAAALPT